MALNDELLTISKDIYNQVSSFVDAHKGNDETNNCLAAILSLPDGSKMHYSFGYDELNGNRSLYTFNKINRVYGKLEHSSGSLRIMPRNDSFGIIITLKFYYLPNKNKSYKVVYECSDDGYIDVYNELADGHIYSGKFNELSTFLPSFLKLYLDRIINQIPRIIYDKESTNDMTNKRDGIATVSNLSSSQR